MSDTRESRPPYYVLRAREVLSAFLFTFIAARVMVYLIMAHVVDNFYFFLGHTHVHHLNYGIFLLSGVGAYLVMGQPMGRKMTVAAVIYGIGLALTFDEFGMWLHLGGTYWQRASIDAVIVIAASLGLFAAAPQISRFRPRHWLTAALVLIAITIFAIATRNSVHYFGNKWGPHFHELEMEGPKE